MGLEPQRDRTFDPQIKSLLLYQLSNLRIRSPTLYPLSYERIVFPKKEVGGRRGSNPRQPDPQSGALPLNYFHHFVKHPVLHQRNQRCLILHSHGLLSTIRGKKNQIFCFFLPHKELSDNAVQLSAIQIAFQILDQYAQKPFARFLRSPGDMGCDQCPLMTGERIAARRLHIKHVRAVP